MKYLLTQDDNEIEPIREFYQNVKKKVKSELNILNLNVHNMISDKYLYVDGYKINMKKLNKNVESCDSVSTNSDYSDDSDISTCYYAEEYIIIEYYYYYCVDSKKQIYEEFKEGLEELKAELNDNLIKLVDDNNIDPVTYEIMFKPCFLNCGHKFNESTILKLLNKYFGEFNIRCPMCRRKSSSYGENLTEVRSYHLYEDYYKIFKTEYNDYINDIDKFKHMEILFNESESLGQNNINWSIPGIESISLRVNNIEQVTQLWNL